MTSTETVSHIRADYANTWQRKTLLSTGHVCTLLYIFVDRDHPPSRRYTMAVKKAKNKQDKKNASVPLKLHNPSTPMLLFVTVTLPCLFLASVLLSSLVSPAADVFWHKYFWHRILPRPSDEYLAKKSVGCTCMDMIYEDQPSEAISGITHQLQSDIHIRLHKNGNCCHEGKPVKLLKGSTWNDVVLTFRANLPDQLKTDESIKFFTSDFEITSTKALQTSLLVGATDALDIMYVEGGALFVWSTRHVGYKFYPTNVAPANQDAPIALETLSESPRVFRVSNFLSNDEMEYLKSFASKRLERSHVGIGKESFSDDRTSRTAWDTNSETSLKIQRRAFDLIRVKYQLNITDAIQIIRYLPGQTYIGHTDYFDHGYDNLDPALPGGTNRFVTIFCYLSDVPEGGK